MNRRQALGTALGGIVAAVVGMKADAPESAEPTITLTGPLAGGLAFTSGVSGETPYIPRDDIGPQAWEWMDADGTIHGPDYWRRIIVRTGAADGYYTQACWVPGGVERLPSGYTTNDAPTGTPLDGPIDANHFGVRWMEPSRYLNVRAYVDGVRVRGAVESYVGEYGWVIRNVPHSSGGVAYLDERGNIVRERVFGRVSIEPWDGA